MAFRTPVAAQRLALDQLAGLPELARHERFAAATPDLVDAILEGAASFAEGEWNPLDRAGDTIGPRFADGRVTMPPGWRDAYRAFVDGGWATIGGPEAAGGQGLPFALQLAVLETLGTANLAFGLCPVLTAGAVEALSVHGSPEQQARYLPRLVSGEWSGTMNLTESSAGSDVGALRTMATQGDDGGWRIKGTKIFISFGEHDLVENIVHLVLARTPGAPAGTKGISLFLVPKVRADGALNDLRAVSIEHKLGLHGSPTCVMSFGDGDGCTGELVGAEGGGMRAMFTMMNNARLNVGMQGVMVAERATQAATAYALDRVQSVRAGSASRESVRIVEHPDVRRMLLRMKALTHGARALLYHAAGQVDRAHLGDEAARVRLGIATPLAKAWATDSGVEAASLGIQVHGGMGYVEETGAAQHYRDARIMPIYEGTNGIQAADLVGRKLTGDGGAGVIALIEEIRQGAGEHDRLIALADDCEMVAAHLLSAEVDDRLAGSAPFLTMLAVATAGWLLAVEARAVADEDTPFATMKRAAAGYFLDQIVAEARGLKAGALAGAGPLYAADEAALMA